MARVLIVDDDRDSCESLSRFLDRVGHDALCETDGRAALRALIQHDPDVIISDLRMPVMGGLAFLKVVRSYIRFSATPVFVMTGVDLDDRMQDELADFAVKQVFHKGKFEFGDIERAIQQAIPPV